MAKFVGSRSSFRFQGGAVMIAAALSMSVVASAGVAGAQEPVRLCGGEPVTILGTAGDDVLGGTDGPDVIAGLQGNDVLLGFGGDDIICGGFGNDVIAGGQGFDILEGSQGDDFLWSNGQLIDGVNKVQDSRGARMFGGGGNDVMVGSTGWDRMQGGDGDDVVFGYEGRDWIRGGSGDDQVDGGSGVDDIFTGRGSDIVEVASGDLIRMGNDRSADLCVSIGGTPGRLWGCNFTSTTDDWVTENAHQRHVDMGREQWVDLSRIRFNVEDQIVAGADEIAKMGLLDTLLPEVQWNVRAHVHTAADDNDDLRTSRRQAETLIEAMAAVGVDQQSPRGAVKRTVTGGGATFDVLGPNGLYSESLSNRVELRFTSSDTFENWTLDFDGCELEFPKATSCS